MHDCTHSHMRVGADAHMCMHGSAVCLCLRMGVGRCMHVCTVWASATQLARAPADWHLPCFPLTAVVCRNSYGSKRHDDSYDRYGKDKDSYGKDSYGRDSYGKDSYGHDSYDSYSDYGSYESAKKICLQEVKREPNWPVLLGPYKADCGGNTGFDCPTEDTQSWT